MQTIGKLFWIEKKMLIAMTFEVMITGCLFFKNVHRSMSALGYNLYADLPKTSELCKIQHLHCGEIII